MHLIVTPVLVGSPGHAFVQSDCVLAFWLTRSGLNRRMMRCNCVQHDGAESAVLRVWQPHHQHAKFPPVCRCRYDFWCSMSHLDLIATHMVAGLLCLVGLKSGDEAKDTDLIVRKILATRLFHDEHSGKHFKNSIADEEGEILCISQVQTTYSIGSVCHMFCRMCTPCYN